MTQFNLLNDEAEITLIAVFNRSSKDEYEKTVYISVSNIEGKTRLDPTDKNGQCISILHLKDSCYFDDNSSSYASTRTIYSRESIDDINQKIADALEAEKRRNLELLRKYRMTIV